MPPSIPSPDASQVRDVVKLLDDARSILFITGAGLSADSGLPTYRGVGGLYSDGDTEEGYAIEVALSGGMFKRRPALVWRHILKIEEACRGRSFNRGHAAIAALEARPGRRVWTLTQNVDGFHRKAGSKNVIDIHGDIHHLHCPSCDWSDDVADYSHLLTQDTPRCPSCDSVIRPDVVLFDEQLPTHKLERLEREFQLGFDIVFSIGTTSVFPYIAQPVQLAHQHGIPTIEINPGTTHVSRSARIKMRSGAAATLGAIFDQLGPS